MVVPTTRNWDPAPMERVELTTATAAAVSLARVDAVLSEMVPLEIMTSENFVITIDDTESRRKPYDPIVPPTKIVLLWIRKLPWSETPIDAEAN